MLSDDNLQQQRALMVEEQIVARGVADPLVLKAMAVVPRHLFVPPEVQHKAYMDMALSIGYQQTISQPYVVALMTESAKVSSSDKILEVGTGSGYQAAILSLICKDVYTIETVAPLASDAKKRLQSLGFINVHVKQGDGSLGWAEHAPFDAIIVTAAADTIPQMLIDQLSLNGRLIMPVGSMYEQELIRITKTSDGLKRENLGPVIFVPLR